MDALRKKAAQVIFPRLGSNMPPPVRVSEDFDRFRQLHEQYQFGGLVLFNGDKNTTPGLLTELQHLSRVPLLVASDIERGTGQQIQGATLFPHAQACSIAGDEAIANFARITAREALACGIHIIFAPVADVNSNPRNPIIGIRAFGSTPDRVSRHVDLFIKTCRAEGLLATAKHFPGHGDTETDSHAELPIVNSDLEALHSLELVPFKTAIHAGAELVMTAHVSFPAIDHRNRAATLSAPVLVELLRNQLGFDGVVVSDSLIMKAIQPNTGDMAVYAATLLNAGLDILLDPPDPEAMLEGVVQAVIEKQVSERRLDDAISRINQLRSGLQDRFGDSFFSSTDQVGLLNTVGSGNNKEYARTTAEQAIQCVRGTTSFARSNNHQAKLALFITPYRTRLDPSKAPIGNALQQAFEGLTYHEVDAASSKEKLHQFLDSADQASEVLAIVVSKPAAWHGYGLPEKLSSFVTSLTERANTTLVSLGDPHILDSYQGAECCICTFSDVPASQIALAQFLKSSHLSANKTL